MCFLSTFGRNLCTLLPFSKLKCLSRRYLNWSGDSVNRWTLDESLAHIAFVTHTSLLKCWYYDALFVSVVPNIQIYLPQKTPKKLQNVRSLMNKFICKLVPNFKNFRFSRKSFQYDAIKFHSTKEFETIKSIQISSSLYCIEIYLH